MGKEGANDLSGYWKGLEILYGRADRRGIQVVMSVEQSPDGLISVETETTGRIKHLYRFDPTTGERIVYKVII